MRVAIVLALAGATAYVRAQDDTSQNQPSEKVADAVQKLRALQEAKNFAGMRAIIESQLKAAAPTSFDAAYLLDMKARFFAGQEEYTQAIEPWEQALKIAEEHKYFRPAQLQEIHNYLARLIYGEAMNLKDKDDQQQQMARAAAHIEHYLARAGKPDAEAELLHAQILYFQAAPESPNPNQALLQRAQKIMERSLQGSVHPKESLYMVLLAILQAQNDHEHAAEYMELVLKNNPGKKDTWPVLFGTYYNLASSAPEGRPRQREYYARAIITIERAQALGFMNSPRDNYNLVTLYIAANQSTRATQLLHEGLTTGKIESTLTNWRILGSQYQQANKPLQAIAALEQAAKLFPHEGSIDVDMGQIYRSLDRTREAHECYARGATKGNTGEKPHLAYLFLAFTSFELGQYEQALTEIAAAEKFPDGAKDPQVKSVKAGIEGSISDAKARAILVTKK